MKELINIREMDGMQVVSARNLHAFLGSNRDFSNWIKDRIEKYGLLENEDFVTLAEIVERKAGVRGSSKRIEYILKLDTAKELAMVEGNEKGRLARRYFIACEKKLRELTSVDESQLVIRRAMELAGSQKELAVCLGVGESTLSEIVNSKGRPSREMVVYVVDMCKQILIKGAVVKRPVARRVRRVDDRLVSLLADVCLIDDGELRRRIVNKLTNIEKL